MTDSSSSARSTPSLRDRIVDALLPDVSMPAQYLGGELHAIVKDPARLRGRLAFAFPDTYAIGMSHHGLQLLYHLVNCRDDWACERVFAPWPDMEAMLRRESLPLCSLETFSPLCEFDIVGFTLQYELCYTNVLTMLDLGGIPLRTSDRGLSDPLVIGGGPSCQNPEPVAPFFDLFVLGDGEEALPAVCDAWIELRRDAEHREDALRAMAPRFDYVYVPSLYDVPPGKHGRSGRPRPRVADLPTRIRPAVVADFDEVDLPTRPIVPFVECVQDRVAVEIMRGCPGRCRFCQSSPLKRPMRLRSVESIVKTAQSACEATGHNEVSLLSLSTSDYPELDRLMRSLGDCFAGAKVNISVPSLRVSDQLSTVMSHLTTDRRAGLTLAPEVARDAMRRRVGKRVLNDDLYEGCRHAFQQGFQRVKLYFMCGLPGETEEDIDGIIEMAETIVRIGRQENVKRLTVIANVSNFVPKPQTAYQWHGMASRQYLRGVHRRLREKVRLRAVQIKCHSVETSLREALFSRGDRQLADVIESAWRAGARFDAWTDFDNGPLWDAALAHHGVDPECFVHEPYAVEDELPWDHITITQGRGWLEREFEAARQS